MSVINFLLNCSSHLIFIAACKQLSRSVQGIFGPSDPLLGAHIQSICEALDVPHLEARVDFEPTFKEFSINLYPAQDHLNKAFKDLISFLNWTRVAIIYEEDYGKCKIIKLSSILRIRIQTHICSCISIIFLQEYNLRIIIYIFQS